MPEEETRLGWRCLLDGQAFHGPLWRILLGN